MFVPLGADVVVGLDVLPVTGAVVPAAAVPEPLTVAALTMVEPDELTLPEPLLVASTTVEPEALVLVVVELGAAVVAEPGVAVAVGLDVVLPVTGAVVPLVAVPEPLTVAALTVVEPVALVLPEPLLIALTVVDPIAVVVVVCARVGLPSARPTRPALTAAAIVLLGCGIFSIMHFSFLFHLYDVFPKKHSGELNDLGGDNTGAKPAAILNDDALDCRVQD